MTQRSCTYHLQLTDHMKIWVRLVRMRQTKINMSMMKMIWVITLIAISSKPISALSHVKNRVGRGSICSISHSMGFTHHYQVPLAATVQGLICMLWHCISLMISGFTAHLRACGWWGFNQRSVMWCASKRASSWAALLVIRSKIFDIRYKLKIKVVSRQAWTNNV